MPLTITEHPSALTWDAIDVLNDPYALVPNKMFQRKLGHTVGDIPIKGTYTGSPATIHYRIKYRWNNAVVVNWTPLASPTISGGLWSGTMLNVPQSKPSAGDGTTFGAAYYLEVSEDGGSTVSAASTVNFRVGINILVAGQSNALGFVRNTELPAPAAHPDEWFFNHQQSVDFPTTNAWTSHQWNGREYLRLVRLAEDCAVSFTAWVLSAAPSYFWIDSWTVPGTNNAAGQRILYNYGMGIEFIVWSQGESDWTSKWHFGGDTSPTKYYLYADRMNQLHTTWTAYLGKEPRDIPFLVMTLGAARIGAVTPGEAFEPDNMLLAMAQVREEQLRANERYPHIHVVGTQVGATMYDAIHQTPAAHLDSAKMIGQGIVALLGKGRPCTPQITHAKAIDARTTHVFIQHGTGSDITGKFSGANFTGFQVWNGAEWLPATANRVNATTIALVTAQDVPTTSARRVGYARTSAGAGANPVKDNGTPFGYLLPTGVMGIEAQPTHEVAVPEFVGGLAHRLSVGWDFSTLMQVPATWAPLPLGKQTSVNRVLYILAADPLGDQSAFNLSLTIKQNYGPDVVADPISRQKEISLFRAVVSGYSTEIQVFGQRANNSNQNFDLCIWQVPQTQLSTLDVSLAYTSVTSQTSATLSLDVGAHDAVIGLSSNTTNTASNTTTNPFGASETQYQVLGVGSIKRMMPFQRTDATADSAHQLVFTNYDTTGVATAATFALGAVVLKSVYEPIQSATAPSVGGNGGPVRRTYRVFTPLEKKKKISVDVLNEETGTVTKVEWVPQREDELERVARAIQATLGDLEAAMERSEVLRKHLSRFDRKAKRKKNLRVILESL